MFSPMMYLVEALGIMGERLHSDSGGPSSVGLFGVNCLVDVDASF